MRVLGRILLWVLLLALATACVVWMLPTWNRLSTLKSSGADEKPLVFFAPGDTGQLRFNVTGHSGWAVFYPVLVHKDAVSPDYRLRLRVLDSGGNLLLEEIRHISHPLHVIQRNADGRTASGRSLPVRWSATQWLDLSLYPSAHAVDVAALPARDGDPGRPVVYRPVVYWRGFLARSLDDREAQARYRGLSRRARAELSEAFIVPPGLLPQSARLDLSRQRLEPAPPLGEHQEITLFLRRARAQTAEDSPPATPRAGWPIAPDLPATLQLTQPTEIELEAYDQQDRPMAVSMHWMEGGSERQRHWPAVLQGPSAGTTLPTGAFEFRSQRPGVLRLRAHLDGRLLLPDMVRLPVFEIGPGTPLAYGVHPLPGRPTRVRLDIRPLDTQAIVRMVLQPQDGPGTAHVERTINARPSRHERLSRDPATAAPEVTVWVVDLPATVRHLHLQTNAPALVTAYVEGVGRGTAAGATPHWFSFLPDNRDRLQQQFVLKQPGWPAPAPRGIAATGAGRFFPLKPDGQVMSQLFLMPEASTPAAGAAEPGAPDRLRSVGPGTLRVMVEPGRTVPLAWLGARNTPTTARIGVDATVVVIPIAGGSGLTQLPPLAPGMHTLRMIDPAGARWMVGQAAGSDWRLRRLWALTDLQPWTLRLRRDGGGRESLHLLVFAPPGAPTPRLVAEFAVNANDIAVVAGQRSAAQRPPTNAWPLWQRAAAWRGPERWSFEIPQTLPAGREINVRLRCSGCREIRALAFRMSETPPPRQLHARAVGSSDDAQ